MILDEPLQRLAGISTSKLLIKVYNVLHDEE